MAVLQFPADHAASEADAGRKAEPQPEAGLLADAVAGLSASSKSLPCKYFYDSAGSVLFDRICELPEYYPTRTELAILREHAPHMAARLGAECLVVEYGSGSSLKTPLLLERLDRPAGYVPVDVARDHLREAAARIASRFPRLAVRPVCADFTRPFTLPNIPGTVRRRAVYFPGSTIGNFDPTAARRLLTGIASLCGSGGGLLIGVDLKKDVRTLEAAYNDAAGVTAAFNLNLLTRLNRELGANFDLAAFRHRAFWNESANRIEMHLVSTRSQEVRLGGRTFAFAAGESIHTEDSHKYDAAAFASLASAAGLRVEAVWTDPRRLFSVQYLAVR